MMSKVRPSGRVNHIQVKREGFVCRKRRNCKKREVAGSFTFRKKDTSNSQKVLKRQTIMHALLGFYTITSWPSSSFLAVCITKRSTEISREEEILDISSPLVLLSQPCSVQNLCSPGTFYRPNLRGSPKKALCIFHDTKFALRSQFLYVFAFFRISQTEFHRC